MAATAVAVILVVIVAAAGAAAYLALSSSGGSPSSSTTSSGAPSTSSTLGTTASSSTSPPTTTSSVSTSPSTGSGSSYGATLETLIVSNDTLEQGSVNPPNNGSLALNVNDVIRDPANGLIYASTDATTSSSIIDSVVAISPSTNKIVANVTLPSGWGPLGMALDSQNGYLYVVDGGNDSIGVIDTASNTLLASKTIPAPVTSVGVSAGVCVILCSPTLSAIAFDPDNGYLYVGSGSGLYSGPDPYIAIVSASTGQIVGNVSLGAASDYIPAVTYDSSNKMVYAANCPLSSQGNVTVISTQTNSVVANIPVGNTPTDVAVDPTNGMIYTVNSGSGTLSVIDPTSDRVVGNITMSNVILISGLAVSGTTPNNIAFDPSNGYLYVTSANGLIAVINPSGGAVIGGIAASSLNLDHIVFDPSNNELYVSDFFSGTLSVVSTS